MENNTYFQQFKTILLYGVKVGAAPILLINIVSALILSIGFDEAFWDVGPIDGIFISIRIIAPFIFIVFLGIIVISVVISSNRRLSNIAAFVLGAFIGTVLVAIGDYSFYSLLQSYEFLPLLSIAAVLLLAYVGQKMNKQVNLDSERQSAELRAVLWATLIAFVGSFAFVLIRKVHSIILIRYIDLGYVLSISLPVAILVGFLIGFIIKKIQKPA